MSAGFGSTRVLFRCEVRTFYHHADIIFQCRCLNDKITDFKATEIFISLCRRSMGKTKQEKDPVFNALKLEREDIGPNSRGDMSKVLITFSSNLDQILKSCPV